MKYDFLLFSIDGGFSCMNDIDEMEEIIMKLSPAERAQLLQKIVQHLGESFPNIESNPDICGGEPRIIRTRIPVWLLVQAHRLGTSDADILKSYPSLRAEDLVNAWAYHRGHREEIEKQIRENEETNT
jgi:uncharacterized protein (DUF433 family)